MFLLKTQLLDVDFKIENPTQST